MSNLAVLLAVKGVSHGVDKHSKATKTPSRTPNRTRPTSPSHSSASPSHSSASSLNPLHPFASHPSTPPTLESISPILVLQAACLLLDQCNTLIRAEVAHRHEAPYFTYKQQVLAVLLSLRSQRSYMALPAIRVTTSVATSGINVPLQPVLLMHHYRLVVWQDEERPHREGNGGARGIRCAHTAAAAALAPNISGKWRPFSYCIGVAVNVILNCSG